MKSISLKKEVFASMDSTIEKVTKSLQEEGFGVLTRIDMHLKMKEKLNKDMAATIILGACNPSLAFRAVEKNTDVTSLMPCNVVLRDVGNGKVSVEFAQAKPILALLEDKNLATIAEEADACLQRAMGKL